MKTYLSPLLRSSPSHDAIVPKRCFHKNARKLLWVTLAAAEAELGTLHTVQTGETLAQIALAYGVSVEQIQEALPRGHRGRRAMLRSDITLKPGQKLIVNRSGNPSDVPGVGMATGVQSWQPASLVAACLGGALLTVGFFQILPFRKAATVSTTPTNKASTIGALETPAGMIETTTASGRLAGPAPGQGSAPILSAVSEVRALLQDAEVEIHAVESALAAIRRAAASAAAVTDITKSAAAVATSTTTATALFATTIAPTNQIAEELPNSAAATEVPTASAVENVPTPTAEAVVPEQVTVAAAATAASIAIVEVDAVAGTTDAATVSIPRPAAGEIDDTASIITTATPDSSEGVESEVKLTITESPWAAFDTATQVAAARARVQAALEAAYGLMLSVPIRPPPGAEAAGMVTAAAPEALAEVAVPATGSVGATQLSPPSPEAVAEAATPYPALVTAEGGVADPPPPMATEVEAAPSTPPVTTEAEAVPPPPPPPMAMDVDAVPPPLPVAVEAEAEALPLVTGEALEGTARPMDAVSAGQVLDRIRSINKLLEEDQQWASVDAPAAAVAADEALEESPVPTESAEQSIASATASLELNMDTMVDQQQENQEKEEEPEEVPAMVTATVPVAETVAEVKVFEPEVEYDADAAGLTDTLSDRDRAAGLLERIDVLLASFDSLSSEDEDALAGMQEEAAARANADAAQKLAPSPPPVASTEIDLTAWAGTDNATTTTKLALKLPQVLAVATLAAVQPPNALPDAAQIVEDATEAATAPVPQAVVSASSQVLALTVEALEAVVRPLGTQVTNEVLDRIRDIGKLLDEEQKRADDKTAASDLDTASALEPTTASTSTPAAAWHSGAEGSRAASQAAISAEMLADTLEALTSSTDAVAAGIGVAAAAAVTGATAVAAAPAALHEKLAASAKNAAAAALGAEQLHDAVVGSGTSPSHPPVVRVLPAVKGPAGLLCPPQPEAVPVATSSADVRVSEAINGTNWTMMPEAVAAATMEALVEVPWPTGMAEAGGTSAVPPAAEAVRSVPPSGPLQLPSSPLPSPAVPSSPSPGVPQTSGAPTSTPPLPLSVPPPPPSPSEEQQQQKQQQRQWQRQQQEEEQQEEQQQEEQQLSSLNLFMQRAAEPALAGVPAVPAGGANQDDFSTGGGISDDAYADVERIRLKSSLLDLVYGTSRGISATSMQRANIEELVESLELRNPNTIATEAVSALGGRWKLVYTTNVATLLLLGALDGMPLVDVGDVVQIIDPEALTATNKIDLAVPLLVSLRAEAGLEVRSPRQFKVRLTRVGLDTYVSTPQLLAALEVPPSITVLGATLDLTPLRKLLEPINSGLEAAQEFLGRAVAPEFSVDSVPVPPGMSRGSVTDVASLWMLTTYLDDTLRISRDDEGRVFVMLKDVGLYPGADSSR